MGNRLQSLYSSSKAYNCIAKPKLYILVILFCIISYIFKVIQVTMTEIKVKRWGNSLALVIPKDIAKHEELDAGDMVKIDISKEKRIDAFGILKGAPRFSKEDEGDSDF
jgi:antitoxin component of MazEF toxin-antitoxin module